MLNREPLSTKPTKLTLALACGHFQLCLRNDGECMTVDPATPSTHTIPCTVPHCS